MTEWGGVRLDRPSMTGRGAAIKACGHPPICCANRFPPRPLRGAPLRGAALTAPPPPIFMTPFSMARTRSEWRSTWAWFRAYERRRITSWQRWFHDWKPTLATVSARLWRSDFWMQRKAIFFGTRGSGNAGWAPLRGLATMRRNSTGWRSGAGLVATDSWQSCWLTARERRPERSRIGSVAAGNPHVRQWPARAEDADFDGEGQRRAGAFLPLLLGRSGEGKRRKGKQDKGSVSRHPPSHCLHILFSGDRHSRPRDSENANGTNQPFPARNRETGMRCYV